MSSEGKKTWWFGIIGSGRICNDFVTCMKLVDRAMPIAIGARSMASASKFAKLHSIPNAYDSYDQVFADEKVDIIYIGTVSSTHKKLALAALEAGKSVIVEKPIGMTGDEAAEIIEKAKERNLFLMEAMWTRCFPAVRHALDLIQNGSIGRINHVQASFGFRAEFDPTSRLYDPKQGGGSLHDIGIYPLTAALAVLRSSKDTLPRISAQGVVQNGVDVVTGVSLVYQEDVEGEQSKWLASDRVAMFQTSFRAFLPEITRYIGSEGYIELCDVAHAPTLVRMKKGSKVEEWNYPLPVMSKEEHIEFPNGEGMVYEIEHVVDCLDKDIKESPWYTWDESLEALTIIQECCKQIGVVHE